jgi:hypothetical protein
MRERTGCGVEEAQSDPVPNPAGDDFDGQELGKKNHSEMGKQQQECEGRTPSSSMSKRFLSFAMSTSTAVPPNTLRIRLTRA